MNHDPSDARRSEFAARLRSLQPTPPRIDASELESQLEHGSAPVPTSPAPTPRGRGRLALVVAGAWLTGLLVGASGMWLLGAETDSPEQQSRGAAIADAPPQRAADALPQTAIVREADATSSRSTTPEQPSTPALLERAVWSRTVLRPSDSLALDDVVRLSSPSDGPPGPQTTDEPRADALPVISPDPLTPRDWPSDLLTHSSRLF